MFLCNGLLRFSCTCLDELRMKVLLTNTRKSMLIKKSPLELMMNAKLSHLEVEYMSEGLINISKIETARDRTETLTLIERVLNNRTIH